MAPPDAFAARAARLRAALRAGGLDGLLVSSLPNLAYLTGLHATAGLLIVLPDRCRLIGDGRYTSAMQARAADLPGLDVVEVGGQGTYDGVLIDELRALAGSRIGLEAAHVTVSRLRGLEHAAREGPLADLVDTYGLVDELRSVKDAWEVATLREGAGRLSEAAKCILPRVLAGPTERDLAAAIEWELRRAGFERPAFDTIVASGPRAALPHARPGTRRIEPGDVVVLDFGGVLHGYATDLTRTVAVPPVAARAREVIGHVIDAQRAAFDAVAPGVAPEAVDAAARGALDAVGLGEAFTHGTGHGLGLEVHELPRVGRARPGRSEPPLAAGMVLTLEPGAYLPGWGGVRIEDDVLVSASGAEWLTDVPRAQ